MQNSTSIENLTKRIAKFNLNDSTMVEALSEQIKALQTQVAVLQTQIVTLDKTTKIEEYEEIKVTIIDAKDISLEMFKTLPEFNGDRTKYTSWRNSAINVMKIFDGHKDKPRYFEALNIVRNKIVGAASEALTNYNTVFNFDAIIARLDFTYADKRPTYIIEQEMIVLQQKNLTFEEFYDEVNKKLNALINKINMTYKQKGVAEAMIKDASEKALRTFVTGLMGNLGPILYASHPASLPDAYAKLQTIINDRERIKFANQYNQPRSINKEPNRINPNFNPNYKPKFKKSNQNSYPFERNISKPEPMDVDKTSMTVNVGNQEKRPRSGEFSNCVGNKKKFQRINQLEDSSSDEAEEEKKEGDESGTDDEKSSVFLDV